VNESLGLVQSRDTVEVTIFKALEAQKKQAKVVPLITFWQSGKKFIPA
jgi:hypothetical protein